MNRYPDASTSQCGYSDTSKSLRDFSENRCLSNLTNLYIRFDNNCYDLLLAGFRDPYGERVFSKSFLTYKGWLDLIWLLYFNSGFSSVREFNFLKYIGIVPLDNAIDWKESVKLNRFYMKKWESKL
jgi:hypothetical protein